MKSEERILNYMDGTLSENESGELLHELSVSPEKRVVLEQHIKLRELTSLAQKPVAVPQALEASMADRFAAIASYNRELAGGAAIIEQAARPSFITKMAAALAGFIAQYPVRTGFAVAAASVIAYFSLAGSNGTDRTNATNMTNGTGSANVISSSGNQGQQQITQVPVPQTTTPTPTSTSTSTSTESTKSSYKSHESHNFSVNSAPLIKANIASHASRNATHITKQSNVNSNAANAEHITPEKNIATPPEKTIASENKEVADAPVNVASVPSQKKDENTNSVSNNEVKENSPKYVASVPPAKDVQPEKNASIALNDVHGTKQEQNPFANHDESSRLPFAFRVYGSLGGSFVNVHQNDATIANRSEAAALIGIDYIFNSKFAFGVEGGNAAISQLITQSALQSSTSAGFPSISRVVVSNVVTSGSQFYARGVAHYTFNPHEAIQFEASGGVGLAFASKLAPLVSASFFLGHDLNEHLSLSGGIAFAGAWTPANAQSSAPVIVASTSDPVGYVTTNHAATTLFTPSYAFRAGLKFRL